MNNNIFPFKNIETVQEYIKNVEHDTKSWKYPNLCGCPWFRGQSDSTKAPLPSVYRTDNNGSSGSFHEFNLTRTFRERSAVFNNTPDRSEIDKWLFLMQHHGLPTRLLDWTESSLIALFFAVYENKDSDRAVWMIHPIELNKRSWGFEDFPNTWTLNNPACANFHAAFGVPFHKIKLVGKKNIKLIQSAKPIAVQASFCHNRMFSQKSCFTIHGSNKGDFESQFLNSDMVANGFFIKYKIPNNKSKEILHSLKSMGITYSSIYPDLDGLAKELKDRFFSINVSTKFKP